MYNKFFGLLILFLQVAEIILCQDIENGRVAYYMFKGNADDSEGSHDGLVNGATPTDDRFGNNNNAYFFDGKDDYIEIPNSPELNFEADEDFSISVWINTASEQSDLNGNNNDIISKWNTLITTPYPYAIRYWNETASADRAEKVFTLRFDSQSCGNNPLITSSCSIIPNEWHHIVFVRKTNLVELYLDGVNVGMQVDNTSLSCNTENNLSVLVGARTPTARLYTGKIDDISFYNRALNLDEINTLFGFNGWIKPQNDLDFISFELVDQVGPTFIDDINNSIQISLPCHADLSNQTALFAVSDGIVSVNNVEQTSGISTNNYEDVVTYKIMTECAEDFWTVNVEREEINQSETEEATKVLSFSTLSQTEPAKINISTYEIELIVDCQTDLTDLVVDFTLPDGAVATIEGDKQISGFSSVDFSNEVIYTVFNKDVCATQDWSVNIKNERLVKGAVESTQFMKFQIDGQLGETLINTATNEVELTLSCNVDPKNLKPIFSTEEGSIVEIEGDLQLSGESKVNFTEPVNYIIKDMENCLFNEWVVQVNYDLQPDLSDIEYYVPNIITPNADGLNEHFKIGSGLNGASISILNKYGNVVYSSESYANDFDGQNQSAGVYFYVIKSDCFDFPIKGPIHIMR